MVRVMVGHTEHVFNEGKSIVRHAISEHRNCDLCPQIPASNPSPELRDAIKTMKHVRNYAEDGTYFIALSRAQIDAVLDALGEPK